MSDELEIEAPAASWRDSLPDDLKESSALKDVVDVDSLAKQFVDQGKFLGNAIRLPGEDATDEVRQEFRQRLLDKNVGLMETPNTEDAEAMDVFYKSLGKPDEASGYTRPENGLDDARFGLLSQAAHEAGISNKQFKSIVGKVIEADQQVMEGINGERETGLTQLRNDWGTAYDSKIKRASKVAELTGAPEGLVGAINDGKVDAATLKWLDGLGSSLGGEQAEMISQGAGGQTGMTKEEARERSTEIHQTLMTMKQSDPRYQGLMDKRMEYTKMYAG